jgi:tRNA modification GTPase
VNACGVPVRVTDSAGLRASADEVEQEGVRRARKSAADADLVVLVCDGGRRLTADEEREAASLASERLLPVVNKIDLGREPVGRLRALAGREPCEVSARTGEGVEALLREFRREAWRIGARGPEAPLTRVRHRLAVEAGRARVAAALELLEGEAYLELAAAELHGARRELSGLLGWGTPEDVLERIFAQFCIGK